MAPAVFLAQQRFGFGLDWLKLQGPLTLYSVRYPRCSYHAPQDPLGQTALIVAAGRGHWEVVEALLGAGANVGHRAVDNTTALHAAASAGCLRCVRALLAAGADPQLQCDMQLQYDEVARMVRGTSSRTYGGVAWVYGTGLAACTAGVQLQKLRAAGCGGWDWLWAICKGERRTQGPSCDRPAGRWLLV